MNQEAKKELDRLLKGNENFVNGTPTLENKCLKTLQNQATFQKPKAVVLSCSDSRVVPEIIFDCGIGELFVVRTAGIGVGPNIIESIEFGVQKLNIPLLILLGHDDCGVMKYAQEKYPEPLEDFYAIMNSVYPVLGDPNLSSDDIARKHTHLTKKVLLKRSHIVRQAYEQHKLDIVEAHFNFSTGKVELI